MTKNNLKNISWILAIYSLLLLTACTGQMNNVNNEVRNIPAGYIGRVLTPTGWEDKIYEAGQVDLGNVGAQGQGSVLILLEASSIAVKEQFLPAESSTDKVDHRVMTKKKIPLEVDCYVRLAVPDKKEDRNNIFALVTAKAVAGDPRVRTISLEDVYTQFAKMDVRGKMREIFAEYEDDTAILNAMKELNQKMSAEAISVFSANGVPLRMQNCQLSNMKVDDVIWQAEVKRAAATIEADRIRTIGKAISENPGYIQYTKWDVIKTSGIKEMTVIDNPGAPLAISVK